VELSSSSETLAEVSKVAGIGRDSAGNIPKEVLITSAKKIGSSAKMD
jgi:hypothetical protein